MIYSFVQDGIIEPGQNETILVLIPKKSNSSKPSKFRPIRLCNVSYKILSKILVNRLEPYLKNIVSPFQNAFVLGCQISDNVMIALEMLHTMEKKQKSVKNHFMALKLGIEKAITG